MITTAAAASAIGASHRTVQRLCAEHGIGTLVTERTRVLTTEDVETLRGLFRGPGVVGNPTFGDPEQQAERGRKPRKKRAKKTLSR